MATAPDTHVSSTDRPLSLRKRTDLQASRHSYLGRAYWIVKDPVALKYFRFQIEEYTILELLDGQRSIDDLKQEFERRFAPERITHEELHQFVGSLHKSGLLLSESPGQGIELFKERRKIRHDKFKAALTNILSLRFRGIDPERLLNWLYPQVRWFFSPWCVTLCMLLALCALLLVTVEFDTFVAKMPSFNSFFTVGNVLWLSVVLGLTKVCHEFGHGLTCKHFGGECHEMGVMLLVLTPCLYCDVSDSWMLPSKWRRMAIGAGGMYVEVVLASLATFFWWFSEEGLLHHLALNVMLICSVSTILFNGNPLLRYDGYYILADWLEIPNLRQKASQVLMRESSRICLGMKWPPDPFLPQRNKILFAIFSVASVVYRWFVLFSILYFLTQFFKPYGLEVIGHTMVAVSLIGLVVTPLWKLWKFFRVPGRWMEVKKKNLAFTVTAVAAIAATLWFVPVPHDVYGEVLVEPRDAAKVYVQLPGTLVDLKVQPGMWVEAGAELALLEDVPKRLEIQKVEARRQEQLALIDALKQQQFVDARLSAHLPQAQATLTALDEQLASLRHDEQRLVLRAPRSGYVLLPPAVPPSKDREQLRSWSGTPFDEENARAFLEPGTLFCQIGDAKNLEGILVVDQADIEFVREGQQVEVLLDQAPGRIYRTELDQVARQEMKFVPRQLAGNAGGRVAAQTDSTGQERPLSTSYQARVPLGNADGHLRAGLRGRAKIRVGASTLAQRIERAVRQTFHFKL